VTPRVVFRPQARDELLEAQHWYEERLPGLGLEFARTVDAAIAAIERFPEAFAQIHADFRQCVLRRFPYSIVYRPSTAEIVVVAVHHQRRHRDSWRKRTA